MNTDQYMKKTVIDWVNFLHYPHRSILQVAIERTVFHHRHLDDQYNKTLVDLEYAFVLIKGKKLLELNDSPNEELKDMITFMQKEYSLSTDWIGVSYAPLPKNWRWIHYCADIKNFTQNHVIVLDHPLHNYKLLSLGGLCHFVYYSMGDYYVGRISNGEMNDILADEREFEEDGYRPKAMAHVIMNEFHNFVTSDDK